MALLFRNSLGRRKARKTPTGSMLRFESLEDRRMLDTASSLFAPADATSAEIGSDFELGDIEISPDSLELAIQGTGFFMVEDSTGQSIYTRAGMFELDDEYQLVTPTGHRLLGYGIDDQFEIQTDQLVPLQLPSPDVQITAPTENVYLQGRLSPIGDLADTAEIIQSGILSDGQYSIPADTTTAGMTTVPVVTTSTGVLAAGGNLTAGTEYSYRIAFADATYATVPNQEGVLSADIPGGPITPTAGNQTVNLATIPDPAAAGYSYFRVYRSSDGGATYNYIDEVAAGTTTYQDDGSVAAGAAFNMNALDDFGYSYYVTYYSAAEESRPSAMIQQIDAGRGGRIKLSNLPTEGAGSQWTGRRIYRNLASDDNSFHLVAMINDIGTTTTYTDTIPDATISTNATIDLDGPIISNGTLLTDVWRRDGATYDQVFQEGTLSFEGRKGGRRLAHKEMEITATSNVLDLVNFMEAAMGIQSAPGPDPANPIPGDAGSGSNPGGAVVDGRIRFIGNNGTLNALYIGLAGMKLTTATGTENVRMPFDSVQEAVGESAVADFIAYDSLGIPLRVRLIAVLESRTATSTTYRWFAESSDNSPALGVAIAVGTGLIDFDGEGNFASASNSTVAIEREGIPADSPLQFELDFSDISGLATDRSTLQVSSQDGSGRGSLSQFAVDEDGTIIGTFRNALVRDLGRIRLAQFDTPTGLEPIGHELFLSTDASGEPIEGNPGEDGLGLLVYADMIGRQVLIDIGAKEGENLINLKSSGKLEVIVLSTATFNAFDVDVDSLTFGRTGYEDSLSRNGRGKPQAKPVDHNGDNLWDLSVRFEAQDAGFQVGDTEGFLMGKTIGDEWIEASVEITTKGPTRRPSSNDLAAIDSLFDQVGRRKKLSHPDEVFCWAAGVIDQ